MKMLRTIREGPFARGLLISLGIHGLVVTALLLDLPWPERFEEPEPEAVEVTLVPPPPEPEPAEQAPEGDEAEEQAAEEPAGEEAAEPPAGQSQAPEPESEPEPAEAEPDPAEPEPAEPEPEPVEPSLEEEQAQQDEAVSTEPDTGAAVPIPTLRPVFEFGEEDRGPDQSPDGGRLSSEAELQTDPPETPPDVAPVAEEIVEPTETPTMEDAGTEPDAAGAQAETEPSEEPQPGLTLPELDLPENTLVPETGDADGNAERGPTLAEVEPTQEPPPLQSDPQADTAEAPESTEAGEVAASGDAAPVELSEADRLFSPDLTQNRAAMSAMGDLPRELRASQLCTTELREQLRYGSPAYRPEMLPAYRLDAGNVLAVPDAAFRAEGAWYDLSFRCTVDDGALRVIGFALTVGEPIPREEWAARGFPEF
ncbi:DUF930 domain-containing protein [Hoeflea sp.]|uniref:DUF930 domain-containing protein n=1 Tax=Hoeflea sp. TaxID=1940281 RepID=UPI003B520B3D